MKTVATLFLLISCSLALRYEAEEGHVMGSTQWDQFGSTVNLKDVNDRILFTANIPQDGLYSVTLRYSSRILTHHVHLIINGYEVITNGELPSMSTHLQLDLPFRWGLNTFIVKKSDQVFDDQISLDYLEIEGSIPLAPQGATLTFFELEAEDAQHNGVVIGPNRSYLSLPSEASGRRAVQLNVGQQVNFTLTGAANAIVVRFSIPDSSNGDGQTGTIGINVNGQQVLTLPVTSKYSWTYGQYPFVNDPNAGNGHHFYDDTRGLFPSALKSGDKVTVTPLSGNFIHTIDLADFYTVPAPYTQPTNSLDVTTYGADPTGKADSTQAFVKAINDSSTKHQVLWLPKGTYSVSQIFQQVTNVTIRGAGPWYTTVQATVPHGVGFFGSWGPPSQDVNLYDFAVFGATIYRDDGAADSATGGALSNTLVQKFMD